MKNLHNLSTSSQTELEEMLAEAERAVKLIEDNPQTPLRVISSYQLDGDEILTIESSLTHRFVAHEVRAMIKQLNEELKTA